MYATWRGSYNAVITVESLWWLLVTYCLFGSGTSATIMMTQNCRISALLTSLQWRHNGRDSVSNHQPHDCLLNRLFRHRSNKTSKLRVAGLCAGNSPGTGEFPAQMASNAENISIWWRHHDINIALPLCTFMFNEHPYRHVCGILLTPNIQCDAVLMSIFSQILIINTP